MARAALWLRVSPAVALAPASVRIEVVIDRHDDNRVLRIAIDSGEYLRSSSIGLDGARAPRVHSVVYRSLPPGYYEVRVELWDQTGTLRAIEHHEVRVVH
jgi:hypothetical protein